MAPCLRRYAIHASRSANATAGTFRLAFGGRTTAPIASAGEVVSLTSGSNDLADTGLVHFKELTKLEYLDISNTKVTDAGLVQLKGLTELKDLLLINTQVTDAGLVPLKGLTKLKRLYLGDTQVTELGVSELQKALPNVEIVQ